MKQIASNYAYSPATNVVTLTGVNIDADQLLLIVAPQVGRTMYNFASVTGSVAAGTDTRVTLNASTAGLTTTSPLVIFYDDQASAQAVTGTVALDPASLVALENITVTVGSSVALAAGSAQIGSVTANLNDPTNALISGQIDDALFGSDTLVNTLNSNLILQNNVPVSGTVTANVGGIASGVTLPVRLFAEAEGGPSSGQDTLLQCNSSGSLNVALPSSGGTNSIAYDGTYSYVQVKQVSSVTVGALPSGSLTTRFGSVVTANLAAITSAVTNTSRKYLLAQNISAGTVTIGIGFSPTTTQGIQLAAGGGLTFDAFCPTGAVYWLGAVTGAAYTILEG